MNKCELSNYMEKLIEENVELRNSIDRKGKNKYLILLHLLINILKVNNLTVEDLLETYKFFIRLRRFIFKWINQIEDYMTSLLEIDDKDLRKIYIEKTFSDKYLKYFKKRNFYETFVINHKLYNNFINYDDYIMRLKFLIKTRNWVCHVDLMYLNFVGNNIDFYSINECIENIKYFIWEECKNGDSKNKWKSFKNQFNDILLNLRDGAVDKRQINIFKKIVNLNFKNLDIFYVN